MRCRGFLTGLRALLPRSDLPGANQPTPLGINRYVLLFCYSVYGSITAAVFFCWPAMAAVILRNEGFSNLCARDPVTGEFINDLRKEADKLYICDAQDVAVQKLFPLTGACCCAMSAVGGALLDWVGPRWTACIGQTLSIIGWILLAFGGSNSTPYVVGMAFIGLGADAGFLPALCLTRVFPGASGFIITVLGSASTASSAVPLVLLLLIEKHGATLKQVALGYIGVGPCFAILVAMLLLPARNFLVDTDTPPLASTAPTPEAESKSIQDKGASYVVKDDTTKDGNSVRRLRWPSIKQVFHRNKHSLPVVGEAPQRGRSFVAGGIEGRKAELEDKSTNYIAKDGRSALETRWMDSAATEGGGASLSEKTAQAASTRQALRAVPLAEAKGKGAEGEEEHQQQVTEMGRQREASDTWLAVELTGAPWAAGADSTSASAGPGETEGVVGLAGKEEGKGKRRGAPTEGESVLCEESREGYRREKCGFFRVLSERAKESRRTGFLHQALSTRYVIIVFYFIGVAWAGAFYQQAPRRMFSDRVVWIMELLQPFGSIPCIILGRLADLCGVLIILTLVNTFGFLMYVLSLNKSDVSGYISVIFFTLYISLFTSQVFIYIEKTFSPVHFGKLIGTAVLIGGLLSFVCNPLYDIVAVNGSPLSVQVAMVVLMCVQYMWIGLLFYLKRSNAHPYREGRARQELCSSGAAQNIPTRSETTKATEKASLMFPGDVARSGSGRTDGSEVTHAAVTVV